jgi:hypothetical protein
MYDLTESNLTVFLEVLADRSLEAGWSNVHLFRWKREIQLADRLSFCHQRHHKALAKTFVEQTEGVLGRASQQCSWPFASLSPLRKKRSSAWSDGRGTA